MTITTANITQPKKCDFCPEQAEYDFRTRYGYWANGCEADYLDKRLHEQLGTGMGQRLVLVKA